MVGFDVGLVLVILCRISCVRVSECQKNNYFFFDHFPYCFICYRKSTALANLLLREKVLRQNMPAIIWGEGTPKVAIWEGGWRDRVIESVGLNDLRWEERSLLCFRLMCVFLKKELSLLSWSNDT